MNIYEFINSKDIRAHCEKIGHTFNSIEAAFLIYQSQNHTLEEKHNAWKALIETMTDAEADLYYSFEGMWIDVPTPFQRGDIVFANYQRLGRPRDPFVLTTLCNDKDTEYYRRKCEFRLKHGDTTDMFAWGHRLQRSNEELWYECAHDYLNLEYFRGDLSGHRRVLKVIHDFYQDKLDVGACMIAYHYILSEEYWKQQKWNYSCMLDGYQYSGKNTDEM